MSLKIDLRYEYALYNIMHDSISSRFSKLFNEHETLKETLFPTTPLLIVIVFVRQ